MKSLGKALDRLAYSEEEKDYIPKEEKEQAFLLYLMGMNFDGATDEDKAAMLEERARIEEKQFNK